MFSQSEDKTAYDRQVDGVEMVRVYVIDMSSRYHLWKINSSIDKLINHRLACSKTYLIIGPPKNFGPWGRQLNDWEPAKCDTVFVSEFVL